MSVAGSSDNDSDDEDNIDEKFPPFYTAVKPDSGLLNDLNPKSEVSSKLKLQNSELALEETNNVVRGCQKRVTETDFGNTHRRAISPEIKKEEISSQSLTTATIIPPKKSKLNWEIDEPLISALDTKIIPKISEHLFQARASETSTISDIISILSSLISVLSQVPPELLFVFLGQMLEKARELSQKKS